MSQLPLLANALTAAPWAITQEALELITSVFARRSAGIRLAADEIAGLKGDRDRPNGMAEFFAPDAASTIIAHRAKSNAPASQAQSNSVVAVINVMGIIAQHASQVDNVSGPGGTSTERVMSSFKAAIADPSVKGIILNVDSPGGNVSGVQALADEIYRSRGRKPIVAQVNSLMASAAYWIGSAADEIVMTPGAQAGSIGVYALHRDVSAAAEKEGIKFTFISAGKYKVEGNAYEPLTDEARRAAQAGVDAYYQDFVRAVARGRGVPVDKVLKGFGEGRTLKDTLAVKEGLADSIAPLDVTIRRMIGQTRTGRSLHAVRSGLSGPVATDSDFRARRHRARMRPIG